MIEVELFRGRPDEVYREMLCDGREVIMEEYKEQFHIRDRFNTFAVAENATMALDYFRNYVPLLSFSELFRGWDCYTEACKQTEQPKADAFWQYLGG